MVHSFTKPQKITYSHVHNYHDYEWATFLFERPGILSLFNWPKHDFLKIEHDLVVLKFNI